MEVEGSILAIKSGGKANKYVGAIRDRMVGRTSGKVYTEEEFNALSEEKRGLEEPVRSKAGFFIVGFWPFQTIHTRNFAWNKIDPKTTEFISRGDPHAIELRWTYAYGIDVVTFTKDLVPLRVRIKLTLRTIDASLSLFGTGEFLTEATALTTAVVRDWVGEYDYEEIVESKKGVTSFDEGKMCGEIIRQFAGDTTPGKEIQGFEFGQILIPNGEKVLGIEVTDPTNVNYLAALEKMKAKQGAKKDLEVTLQQIETKKAEAKKEEEGIQVAKHKADQAVEEGRGEAEKIRQIGDANADAKNALIRAEVYGLAEKPEMAEHVRDMTVAESLSNGIAGASTIAVGNSGLLPFLNVGDAGKKAEAKPKEEEEK
jgi:regulator of protease activity HflC (stomatin/prohibitin superfamily)